VTDSRQPKPPKTQARLEQLITRWQKDSGQPVGRLNLRIAAMMLAGALARVTDPNGEGVFATKGGIAMELRLGDRATKTPAAAGAKVRGRVPAWGSNAAAVPTSRASVMTPASSAERTPRLNSTT